MIYQGMFPGNYAQMLAEVNEEVNALPYTSDQVQYQTPEFWESIDDHGSGDCEDFAIGKLRRLWQRGYPIEALHLATCEMPYPKRGGHCVLVADAPGNWQTVLSNGLHIMSLNQFLSIGFRPIQIQETGGQRKWVEWSA